MLNRLPLFRSAADRSAAEYYNKLLPAKKGPYQIVDDGGHTLKIVLDGSENTVSNYRTTMIPGHRGYWDSPVTERDSASSSKPDSNNVDRSQQGTYIVDKNVCHVRKGAKLRYVGRRYGYTKTKDTTELSHHIPQCFIDSYWRRVSKKENEIRPPAAFAVVCSKVHE